MSQWRDNAVRMYSQPEFAKEMVSKLDGYKSHLDKLLNPEEARRLKSGLLMFHNPENKEQYWLACKIVSFTIEQAEDPILRKPDLLQAIREDNLERMRQEKGLLNPEENLFHEWYNRHDTQVMLKYVMWKPGMPIPKRCA